jgi:phosphatidate cytidylyltransferase
MLKKRLIYGVLMTIFFTSYVLLDSFLDGSISSDVSKHKQIQATGLFILVCLILIAAQFELVRLAEKKNLSILLPVALPASILLAGSWFWSQALTISVSKFVIILLVFSFLALLLYSYKKNGIGSIMANCGISLFSIIYLGLLTSFVIAIRIEFGIWYLLMFVFVVKVADIGAYTVGTLTGWHKFSPVISPGKTWEGMIGAVIFAVVVSYIFSKLSGIMSAKTSIVFGVCFAFIGQMGDLAESLIKRDSMEKDSAKMVPGFGGVLDIIDSLLGSAVFAYLFFVIVKLYQAPVSIS